MPSKRSPADSSAAKPAEVDAPPRIIGGDLRGRKLVYSGDMRTRPMKDRVREAIFNLIGVDVEGKHAVDLFAGTGALGLEAISRGASGATFVERHFPTADLIKQSAKALEVEQVCTVLPANTLLWPRRWPNLPATPWAVFCSPPYDLYLDHAAEMLALVGGLMDRAAPGSVFCVEADQRFDFNTLPHADQWDVRTYPPAVVGIWRKEPLAA
ncbi:MAG TPA: RsmD family RNA methyltransferase [Pirellulales bacterium]|jgi:16S rRNA (guanine(966)-N(2))-methyltransferase RsmD